MTQASFVDWQRYVVPGANVAYQVSATPNPSIVTPSVDMSPWAGMLLAFVNQDPSLYMEVVISFRGFQGVGTGQTSSTIVVGPNQAGVYVTDVQDRTVQITVQPVTGTATGLFELGVFGTQVPVHKYDAYRNTPYLIMDHSTYVANQVKTFTASPWFNGKILVTATSSAGAGAQANFMYYDSTLPGWVQYATVPVLNSLSGAPIHMFVPPGPLQVQVANTGTGQQIGLYVFPEPD